MKKNLLRASIGVVLAAAALCAQSRSPIRVNVPFDFIAGGKMLQAGAYTVDLQSGAATLLVRSADCKEAAGGITERLYSRNTRTQPILVFHRYGETYFLAEVWDTGNEGRQLITSKLEKAMVAREAPRGNTTLAAVR